MTRSMILSTVLFASIVLQLTTTTTAQWKSCFDDSCPIKNLKYPYDLSSKYDPSESKLMSYPNYNHVAIIFSLESAVTGVDRLNEIHWQEKDDLFYVLFTCGPVAKTSTNDTIYPMVNGTAIYISGKVLCSWSMDPRNLFPYDLIDPPQYFISDRGYQIYYNLTQTVPIPAADHSQLPKSVEPFVDGYKYKAVGSEKYLLVARRVNETTDFLLKVNGETPRLVEVKLKNDTLMSIDVDCDFKKRIVYGWADIVTEKANIWSSLSNNKVNGNECTWSLPDSFGNLYGIANLKETVYELLIIEDNMFVYFDKYNFRVPTSD
uniref:Dipeptidylpeptidase IV N-terminal domain-containing protein n=1 Tax=Tetranychus urticae TaxID=32264 RepID=T1KTY3_TETUR